MLHHLSIQKRQPGVNKLKVFYQKLILFTALNYRLKEYHFKYLESTIITNDQAKDEAPARNAFILLTKPLWDCRKISMKTRLHLFSYNNSRQWKDTFNHFLLPSTARVHGMDGISYDCIHLRSNAICINNFIIAYCL